jgi:hypothetical protein
MELVLVVIGGVTAAGALTAGSVALSMRSRLQRGVRLVPGRRADVPWQWRWSPGRAAMLHRRLQRACQTVLAATGGPSAHRPRPRRRRGRRRAGTEASVLQTTGRALLDQAVGIDLRLVAAHRGGSTWRRLHLPALSAEVATLEASSVRLAQLSLAFDEHLDAVTTSGGTPAERADLLLDAMEAAIADLRQDGAAAET